MSVPATEPPVDNGGQPQGDPAQTTEPVSTGQETPPASTETRPPYADILDEIPESLRPVVEPKFKEWDAGVTQRFQELHSRYEPWKDIVEGQLQPDDVIGALQVASILENDPKQFFEVFKDAFPDLVQEFLGQGQPTTTSPAAPNGEQGQSDLDPDDPLVQKITQLEQALSQVTGTLTEQQQQEQAQQQQEQLDQILNDMHEKHGDFDDNFILSQMAFGGATPQQAIEAWNNLVGKLNTPTPTTTAPTVVPSSNGVPSTAIKPEELDNKGTRDLVAQILQQAAEQSS